MKTFPFYSALSEVYDTYGIELDEDLFENYAWTAWRKIGNKQYKLYRTVITPEKDPEGGWYVCKPCNLDSIEAITLPFEYAQETSSVWNHNGFYTHPVEENIEVSKRMPNALYIPGKFVKYRELGDRIYFTEPFKNLNLLYKGLYTDENGLPYLTEKEIDAIALYCAYVYTNKKGLMSKDI
jgi:alpha-N-acetylglucosamine transferase